RHPADHPFAQADLVAGRGRLDLELAQQAVRVAAVVPARDRLLARVAALRERDVRLLEAGLGRENRLVELLPPGRRARVDPQRLELAGVRRFAVGFLPGLPRLGAVVLDSRAPARVDEVEVAPQRLDRDLALRREAGA